MAHRQAGRCGARAQPGLRTGAYNDQFCRQHFGSTLAEFGPPGEWNHLRLLITPEKCEHEMNGVLYFSYVMDSADFAQRLATSKFARMSKFAKAKTGFLALQGDHGLISFRNLKIRPIAAKK